MNRSVRTALVSAVIGVTGCTGVKPAGSMGAGPVEESPRASLASAQPGLPAFASEEAFETFLAHWAEEAGKRRREQQARHAEMLQSSAPMPPPAPASVAAPSSAFEPPSAGSITNLQTPGVDEGGIVKRHGDHLVVLRRGRLFTVRIGGDSLRPVSTVDAFGPGINPAGAWYDEMLVAGDTVVVIGYSYARGGTELVRFRIDGDGALSYRDTWHLRSNDYFSSRNYASRLVGETLILYTPLYVNAWNIQRRDFMPAVRRWSADAGPDDFKRLLPATRLYRADENVDPFAGMALHTVVRCDLGGDDLDCSAVAVLGAAGRVFHVSADSVFVWTTRHGGAAANSSMLVRIPLDEGKPTALRTRGVPIDQLSFQQGNDGHLNVMLTQAGAGEGMWGEATQDGELALLRVDLGMFGDGRDEAPANAYRRLPGQVDGPMQNRYIGDWLVYGHARNPWARATDSKASGIAYAVRHAGAGAVQAVVLGHGVERIEAMGTHAIVVGSAKADLHFSSLRMEAGEVALAGVYVQAQAAQGENRTHGFFYKDEGGGSGVVGLPVIGQPHGSRMQSHLSGSAAVLYLRNRDLDLSPLGELAVRSAGTVNDHCRASCVDWYGNARPIFIGDRVFALLGYELVEGRIESGRVVERRRTNFAPSALITD